VKKAQVLALTMAMLTTAATSYAAVPSKTTSDIGGNVNVVVAGSDLTASNVAIVSGDEAAVANQELERIYNEVVNEGKTVVECFPREIRNEISDVFPGFVDIDKLEMNEFVPVKITGLNEVDSQITFDLTTNYTITQKLAVLIGVASGEKAANGDYVFEWIPMTAEATTAGSVKVNIPKEHIAKIQNSKSVVLVVLSEPAN